MSMKPTTHIILRFLTWYVVLEPLKVLRGYKAYARALFEIIPFGFLLLTLFRPWKNIVDRRTAHGFSMQHIVEKMSMSVLARGTGCLIRIVAILIGLVLHAIVVAGTIVYLVLWLSAPVWMVMIFLKILSSVAGA